MNVMALFMENGTFGYNAAPGELTKIKKCGLVLKTTGSLLLIKLTCYLICSYKDYK